jgi:hypothetical protein
VGRTSCGAGSTDGQASGPGPNEEAPHSLHDTGTLEQARDLFTGLGARVLVVSGTHRCANAAASGRSGTTAVCDGTSGPFRVSDMAHTEQSAFHAAHRALAEHFGADSGVTTCNAFPGSVPWADRLCGTSDVQGRHVNGASPACIQAAPAGAGRFIHLEQSRAVRTEPTSVRAALDAVLPAAGP